MPWLLAARSRAALAHDPIKLAITAAGVPAGSRPGAPASAAPPELLMSILQ